jgi:hypothetical protein
MARLSIGAALDDVSRMSLPGPRLPTWALQQDGSYLGYSGHQINVVVTAARDPEPTCRAQVLCGAHFSGSPSML